MKFRDVEHLFRLAAIFVFGTLLFVVVKAQMTPTDFGRDGHYRPASVDDGPRPADLVRRARRPASIATATSSRRERWRGTRRWRASRATGRSPGTPAAPTRRSRPARTARRCACGATRRRPASRSAIPTVDIKEHAGDENCLTCHKPHDPRIG